MLFRLAGGFFGCLLKKLPKIGCPLELSFAFFGFTPSNTFLKFLDENGRLQRIICDELPEGLALHLLRSLIILTTN